MNKYHHRRLYLVSIFIIGLMIATGLILYALKQNINAFYTPSQLAKVALPADAHIRLGGMVVTGSVKHDKTGLGMQFIVTDLKQQLPVRFVGVPPDLFHEGKGVIAEGRIEKGVFMATQILAKHDENYMPKNVYKAMRENAA